MADMHWIEAMGFYEPSAGRQLRLFANMSGQELKGLLATSTVAEVPPQYGIFEEGKAADFLHIVLEGTVELFGRCGSREATIDIMRSGDSFILAAVVKNAPYLMSARAMRASRILQVPAGSFRACMRRDQALALAASTELSRAFRTKVRQLRSQKLRSAQMRVASYLMVECKNADRPTRVFLTMTKKTLASLLGLEPESLSRVFASLEPYGVEVDDNKIFVREPAKLRALAMHDDALDLPE